MIRVTFLTCVALASVSLLGAAGGDKVTLTDEQFSKLVSADAKYLHDALAKDKIDKKAARKIQAAALMISACTECTSHSDGAAARRSADELFFAANKGDWARAKTAGALLYPKVAASKSKEAIAKNADIAPYMYYFANERVGGFGIEQEMGELQETKGKFTDAQFSRLSDIGTRSAVIGQAADRFAPEKDVGKQTKKTWLALTVEFRQTALALAAAANAKNEADARKALSKLDAACTKCHDVFK